MYFCNFTTLFVKYSYLYLSSHGVYGRKVKKRNKHQYVNEYHLISHHWSNIVVMKFIAHFRTVKLPFLQKSCHCEIQNHFWCLNWRKRGEFAPEFQMLSKFSLVFINTTASSKVVNHASTVNVFSCKNLQFELPQNFISQIDRGSIALSLEYHNFSNESHVPGRDFRR